MTVILANGEFPSHPVPLGLLDSAERVVCCDGAAARLVRHGREPDFVVGDMDSLPRDLMSRLGDRAIRFPGQDDNDLAKAFRFCIGRGWRRISILGATGLREDHSIGNIGHLFDFAAIAPEVEMVTDYGVFAPVTPGKAARRFSSFPGQQVSIFAGNAETIVTSGGLHWPLSGTVLSSLWGGTLNMCDGDSFEIGCEGAPALVFRTHRDTAGHKEPTCGDAP